MPYGPLRAALRDHVRRFPFDGGDDLSVLTSGVPVVPPEFGPEPATVDGDDISSAIQRFF